MRGVLRLVGAGVDGQKPAVDIKEFNRPDCLEDIANLGLTLTEGKQLLARVQQEVVAAQFGNHAVLRPSCCTCNGRCHVKDWRLHRIATLFGEVRVRLPRFLCAGCGHTETGVSWPSHCRSTPALDQLQAHLSALITYRVAATYCCTCYRSTLGRVLRRCAAIRCRAGRGAAWRCGGGTASHRCSGNHAQLGIRPSSAAAKRASAT